MQFLVYRYNMCIMQCYVLSLTLNYITQINTKLRKKCSMQNYSNKSVSLNTQYSIITLLLAQSDARAWRIIMCEDFCDGLLKYNKILTTISVSHVVSVILVKSNLNKCVTNKILFPAINQQLPITASPFWNYILHWIILN